MIVPKYAPAREDGDKPYVISIHDWGKDIERLGWGATASEAKYDATGRKHVGMYVNSARRATPDDVERLS